MKKILLIIAMALSLSGCIATALVVGAAAGGAVMNDSRGMNTMIDDQNISYQAETNINSDPQLKNKARVSVVSFNKSLLLVGQVPTLALKTRAGDVVYKENPELKRVYNQLTISEPISTMAATNDSYITSKVKADMLAEKGLNSTQIKVVTEDSVVYLMGLVSQKQGALAAKVASNVSGVKRVVKVFEYSSAN
jgi:osmotically-inducible protein OsmY